MLTADLSVVGIPLPRRFFRSSFGRPISPLGSLDNPIITPPPAADHSTLPQAEVTATAEATVEQPTATHPRLEDLYPTSKYPWERWTDAAIHTATQGVDFDSETHSFASVLRRHAADNELQVVVRRRANGDPKVVHFQFRRP